MKLKAVFTIVLSLAVGVAAGAAVERYWAVTAQIASDLSAGRTESAFAHPDGRESSGAGDANEKKILYWVAPMDPSYRRDEPGKSPMGMDLIPVYEGEETDGSADDASVVQVSPAIINSLGVRTEAVRRGDLYRRIETVGYIDYDESKISQINLRSDGWIERLLVKSVGERVRKGELIFELYSPTLINAQAEFLQAYGTDRRNVIEASRGRLRTLGISENQIDALADSGQIAERIKYYATQDGVVTELNVVEGNYVKPDTRVMTLADLSTVWLLADVFEQQASWVQVGQSAEVRLSYLPGNVWTGSAEFVYPSLDPKTRSLKVRLKFDNPEEELKPGMYADVTVFADAKPGILSIARDAVIPTGNSKRVIVVLGDGRFHPVEVVSGVESGDRVEIISGLEEGDEVVVSAQFLIDSESSLKAGFRRMSEIELAQVEDDDAAVGEGIVNAITVDERKINISHDPIPSIGWPKMTMDFSLDTGVDLEGIETGERVRFHLREEGDGGYSINAIEPVE